MDAARIYCRDALCVTEAPTGTLDRIANLSQIFANDTAQISIIIASDADWPTNRRRQGFGHK